MEEVKIDSLTLHAEALTTPRMLTEQFEALKDHIDKHGQLEPATTYRGKIVDGRHRWLALQELGIETIKIERMPNNSTLRDIKNIVRGKETRRHETASQLAITAYRLTLDKNDPLTQADACSKVGANRKRVSEAKKIATVYGRSDILELLFNGEKFNTGTTHVPFYTDSLGTILKWLSEYGVISGANSKIGLEPRTELTEDEQSIVNQYINVLKKESAIVQQEVINMGYAMLKEEE